MKKAVLCFCFFMLLQHSVGQQIHFQIVDAQGNGIEAVKFICTTNLVQAESNQNGSLIIDTIRTTEVIHGILFKPSYESVHFSIDPKHPPSGKLILDHLTNKIEEIEIVDSKQNDQLKMRSVEQMVIYEAKKSERISVQDASLNLAVANGRQVFSKISGMHVWESQSGGISTEIGIRGLAPDRAAHFNIRQNQYEISADPLGYPDAYYTPPLQLVDEIQLVRGSGSIQYGSQFGGMLNYKLKTASKNPFHFESQHSVGSYGFFSTYQQMDGSLGNTNYMLSHNFKKSEGWRPNSSFKNSFIYGATEFKASKKLSLKLEQTYYYYLAQQAGGLTDLQFKDDLSQSNRARNWFEVNWHLSALKIQSQITPFLKFKSNNSLLVAGRNALGFLGAVNRIDPLTERGLLVDNYFNRSSENKLLTRYTLLDFPQRIIFGYKFLATETRKRQGIGSKGSDANFDFATSIPAERSDYSFPSINHAIFAEQILDLSESLSLTTGIRMEHIQTLLAGSYNNLTYDLAGNVIYDTTLNESSNRKRQFAIASFGASYDWQYDHETYSSFSTNYRAINANDFRIVQPGFKVNPNLEDERGFNWELGIRGKINDLLNYDFALFYLQYKNRIGSLLQKDTINFRVFRYRTNIGVSANKGIESLIEINYGKLFNLQNKLSWTHFLNLAVTDARYIKVEEPSINGNRVESVPLIMLRSGMSWQFKQKLNFRLQTNYYSSHFSDATNATITSDAISGLIPSYFVADLAIAYQFKWFKLELDVNNITDQQYFTRRASGYPGPGILPAPPMNGYLTLKYDFSVAKKP